MVLYNWVRKIIQWNTSVFELRVDYVMIDDLFGYWHSNYILLQRWTKLWVLKRVSGHDCVIAVLVVLILCRKAEQKCEEIVKKSCKKLQEIFVYQSCMIQYGKCQKFYHDIVSHDRGERDNKIDMYIASVQCNSHVKQTVQRWLHFHLGTVHMVNTFRWVCGSWEHFCL